MEIRTQAHVAYRLQYHVVWIPKYRYKVLVKGVDKYCEEVIRNYVIDRYPDVEIYELNVQRDHVHLLASIPPKYAVSAIIGKIKSNSSRELRKKFEYLRRPIILSQAKYSILDRLDFHIGIVIKVGLNSVFVFIIPNRTCNSFLAKMVKQVK